MNSSSNGQQENPPSNDEKALRQRRQTCLIAAVMVFSFCLMAFLLFVVGGLIFGAELRHLVSTWMGQ